MTEEKKIERPTWVPADAVGDLLIARTAKQLFDAIRYVGDQIGALVVELHKANERAR